MTSRRTAAGVGISQRAVVDHAVAEVVAQALSALEGRPPRLVLVYAGITYDLVALHAALSEALPGVPIVGASSQGVSVLGRSLEAERFLAIAVIGAETLDVRVGEVADLRIGAFAAGLSLAEQMGPPVHGPSTTLLYYDPLGGADIEDTVRGLDAGGYPRVYGAGSGQPWSQMVASFQLTPSGVYEHGAVAVTIVGLEPIADLTHGAESTGIEVTVTRAKANVLEELDGRPALDVWCEQLGVAPEQTVENTSNWALGIRPPAGVHYEGLVTRAPFRLDVDRRAIVLQAPIAEGARVQVCIRTQPAVFEGALSMGERLRSAIAGERPVLALAFECGARPAPFLGRIRRSKGLGGEPRVVAPVFWAQRCREYRRHGAQAAVLGARLASPEGDSKRLRRKQVARRLRWSELRPSGQTGAFFGR